MAYSDDLPARRQPGNRYFIHPQAVSKDIARLVIQDQMLNYKFGGLLPTFFTESVPNWNRVLDLACGTGGWLCAMAEQYPHIKQLDGLDIMNDYVAYAQEEIKKRQLADRITIERGDVMMDPYKEQSFDLVHMRLGSSFLSKLDWPLAVDKIYKLLRPGRYALFVEAESAVAADAHNTAFMQMETLFVEAFERSMQNLSSGKSGTINALPELLKRYLYEDVHAEYRKLEFQAGTEDGQLMIQDIEHAFNNVKGFIQKWVGLDNHAYDTLKNAALLELHQPDFTCSWTFGFIWGRRPTLRRFGG